MIGSLIPMAKKKRRPDRQKRPSPPRQLRVELEEAARLIRRRELEAASDLLESLNRRYPQRWDVLVPLVHVYQTLRELPRLQVTCEQLVHLKPNDPDLALLLAGTYLANTHVVLGLRGFQRFLDRWPEHAEAAHARRMVAELQARLPEYLEAQGLPGADGPDLVALHEEIQALLTAGQFRQVQPKADELLQRRPEFAPAWNNRAEAYYQDGQPEQAIAAEQRVLAFAPDNFHALSNLIRFLVLSGRTAEAAPLVERLKGLSSGVFELWVKKAEALSYLGEDQAVLDALAGAEPAIGHAPPRSTAFLYHLAAVAAWRLDRSEEARRHWKEALRQQSGFALARDNLADLNGPVGQRHAPWPFPLNNWLREKTLGALGTFIEQLGRKKTNDQAVAQAAQRFLQAHPEIPTLVSALLDRGDPAGREFGLRMAMLARTPAMLASLRDFALGKRGPDQMRMQAAEVAVRSGLLPQEPTRLWVEGEWREILLMGFELHGEPEHNHSRAVANLAREGTEALYQGDTERAERLFQQGLAQEPEAPDLLNNLAMTYMMRGEQARGEAMVRAIHQAHPDYFFGRIGMAQLSLKEGDLVQAKALLRPLLTHRRLHFSEFAALCQIQMELLLAEGNEESARSWLALWESGDPNNPRQESWRRRLGKPKKRSWGRWWRS
jgi:tetratricopeptide (TPR) repeat protein